ncbi:ubiquitin-conjugating enzyme E2 Z-like [Macrosteles quadrilineatus]|uniref:ubiquitin-conjugating enzyme E2 Z-like n=1 Tax=Macrosteles quadrilineatus TaxID=74068 RepID=UPI0023E1393B|nr:ubiquitin-conjugating enzyme E2 Z-like [Macrosteles quadrilineatus]
MDWDPFNRRKQNTPTEANPSLNLRRIKRDITTILNDPPRGVTAVVDEDDMNYLHCLIKGTENTPYGGGFFYFVVFFPPNYPFDPPKVKLMTTGGGTVRFNPNFYESGKVCLSILNTWSGPEWTPAQNISSVLVTIQSIMNEKPYYNEPGTYDKGKHLIEADKYNVYIQYETFRVAVVGMLDNDYSINLPQHLLQVMEKDFLNNYEFYDSTVTQRCCHNGKRLECAELRFIRNSVNINYNTIKRRMKDIRERLNVKYAVGSAVYKNPEIIVIDDSD